MTLEALRLRVETRQRARCHYREQGLGGSLLPPGTCEAFGEARRERTANATIDSTYESLMEWREEVSVKTWKYYCGEARLATLATTRSTISSPSICANGFGVDGRLPKPTISPNQPWSMHLTR